MLENQFIQFSAEIKPQDQSIGLPVCSGISTLFFAGVESDSIDGIDMVTPNGDLIKQNAVTTNDGYIYRLQDVSDIAPEERFRLRINKTDDTFLYSNILCRHANNTGMSIVVYYCKEPAFGFPFNGKQRALQQIIPINLHSPQYKQEDKIYTKLNGEQVVLFANITKEYDGETDYIPMEWHEKILMALSCDEVAINGERVTKSGAYEIDHDNFTYSDCGIKLMRATFKVTTNVTQRNSNY